MRKKVVISQIVDKLNVAKEEAAILTVSLLHLPQKGLEALKKAVGVKEEEDKK
jgi:hypothetical protein